MPEVIVSFIVHLDVEGVDLSVTFSAKSHHVSIQDSDMPHLGNQISSRLFKYHNIESFL